VNAPASIPAVDCVTLEHSFPHLAIVTLNRPEVRNAIDGCVATTLARFVAELGEDRGRSSKSVRPAGWAAE